MAIVPYKELVMKINNYNEYSNGQLSIAWDKIMLLNLAPYELATHENLISLIAECDSRKIKPWDRSLTSAIN
jgi:hypothetical protein